MLSNRRSFKIEWGDCDPSGIVFNPNYFAWFDISVHALLESAGVSLRQLMSDFGIDGLPLVENRAKFLAPSRFGDTVMLETTVSQLHRSGFDLHHRLLNKDVLAVEAFETRIWTVWDEEQQRIRAKPLPPQIVALLSGAG